MASGGGLPPLPKSLSGLLSFSRESFSRAEATIGGILGSNPVNPPTPAGNSRGGSSSSSSGYISSSSTASPSVVAKENVAPTPTSQLQQQQLQRPPQAQQHQQQQQPLTGFQQYSSVKSDPRPNPSPSPFRPIQSPGPRAFQVR